MFGLANDCVRTEPQAAGDCSCTTPMKSPAATVTGGDNVTTLRPLTALNGPRDATSVNAATELNVWRRKTILKAFEQLALQATVALLTVPAAVAPALRLTYVTGPPVVMVAVPPLSTICVPTVSGWAARETAMSVMRTANVERTGVAPFVSTSE